MIKRFNEYIKENDGGGVAMATLGNTGGMGAVIAPTVGTSPGAVWGSGSGEKGSGDIASSFGVYTKGNISKKKKKKKGKTKQSKLGEDFRNMYVTKFTEWDYYPEKKVNENNNISIKVGDDIVAERNGELFKGKCITVDKKSKMIALDIDDYAWFYYEKTNQLSSEVQIVSVNGKKYK